MNDTHRQFIGAFEANQEIFGVALSTEKIFSLVKYYEFVERHNALLHLVAPAPAETFAVRHVLESLAMLEFLPKGAKFADVGAGAGLPSVPCLIARPDLRGVLIESKLKKAAFLEKVLLECRLKNRVEIFNRQFEELPKPDVSFVTCRALDKFTLKLPRLLKWSGKSKLLFFGGQALGDELKKHGVRFEEKLMPLSEQRFLFASVK